MNNVFGEKLSKRIATCKILVIGAGGIGCEMLKNLALSGFRNVETIDLDTIDVSNLNRQFLFRKEHVGMSKANVAKEAVLKFNPDVNIVAHHGNVKRDKFNLKYFKQFTIVMNALDNVGARRHVNRLCIAANIPLIEAGSTGDLGQAYTIKKGVTECYECQPKAAPKKYPICTIRSTYSRENVREHRFFIKTKKILNKHTQQVHQVSQCIALFGLKSFTSSCSVTQRRACCLRKTKRILFT